MSRVPHRFPAPARGLASATSGLLVLLVALPPGSTALGRERAVEQIPELMGRILESQEEIQAQESQLRPLLDDQDERLGSAREAIERAGSEAEAAEALVDYVEAYDRRSELQAEGLRAIQAPIVRMRDDARALVRAAEVAQSSARQGRRPAGARERKAFYQSHFQGLARGLSELAAPLGREEEAGIAASVLHAGWASHQTPELPLIEMGPEGANAFARRAEGLYARYQARASKLSAERVAVRQLLDLLIQRQLSQRLEGLFAGSEGTGVSDLFAASGMGEDWEDLGSVVGRALGLPSQGGAVSLADHGALERLDYFAEGHHFGSEQEGDSQ